MADGTPANGSRSHPSSAALSAPGLSRTDELMLLVDVPRRIRYGLAAPGRRVAIGGDATVAAAILADRCGVDPRSLAFLAEVVRRGGRGYALELTGPLPTPAQIRLVHPWLAAAAASGSSVELDEAFARWLEAVASIIALRRSAATVPHDPPMPAAGSQDRPIPTEGT